MKHRNPGAIATAGCKSRAAAAHFKPQQKGLTLSLPRMGRLAVYDIETQPSARYSVNVLKRLSKSSFVPTTTLTDSYEHALWIVSGVAQAQIIDHLERKVHIVYVLDTAPFRALRKAHKIFMRQERARAKRKRRKLLLNRLRAR